FFPRRQRQAIVVYHDQHSIPDHRRARLGKVQTHYGNPLAAHIPPYVEFRPVAQREHPHAFAFGHPAVVELPKLWTLVARIPLMIRIAMRENTLLRPAGFLVAACAPENAVVAS